VSSDKPSKISLVIFFVFVFAIDSIKPRFFSSERLSFVSATAFYLGTSSEMLKKVLSKPKLRKFKKPSKYWCARAKN
jgi:hypothetical protein